MPQEMFSVPPIMGDFSKESVNRIISELNRNLMAISTQLGQLQGRNGNPTFNSMVDMTGNRITNLAPSQSDSDPVTRGELVAYGLFQRRIGDPHVASVTGTLQAIQGAEIGNPTQPRHATDQSTANS